MPAPRVQILYFDGCPSYAAIAPAIRDVARSEGAQVELIRIESVEQAERERLLGSPTVRVDGVDVDPTAAGGDHYGMKCRLYVTRRAAGRYPRTRGSPPRCCARMGRDGA